MEKIKSFIESSRGKDILTVVIVIFVGASSFSLGRLSKSQSMAGIKIQLPDGSEQIVASAVLAETGGAAVPKAYAAPEKATSAKGNYFASSRGQKYYSIGCSAGKTIKVENRVYFATSEAAEKAGYEKSASCK